MYFYIYIVIIHSTINSRHPLNIVPCIDSKTQNGLSNYLQLETIFVPSYRVQQIHVREHTHFKFSSPIPILSQLIDLQTKQDLKQVCLLFLHQSAETDLKALCNQTFLIQTSTLYFRAGKLITDIQTDILLTLRIRKRKEGGGGARRVWLDSYSGGKHWNRVCACVYTWSWCVLSMYVCTFLCAGLTKQWSPDVDSEEGRVGSNFNPPFPPFFGPFVQSKQKERPATNLLRMKEKG